MKGKSGAEAAPDELASKGYGLGSRSLEVFLAPTCGRVVATKGLQESDESVPKTCKSCVSDPCSAARPITQASMVDEKEERAKGRNWRLLALACLLSCALSWSVEGQSGRRSAGGEESVKPAAAVQDETEVLRVRTDEVLLPISVRDGKGTPVKGLRAEDFLVYDNGVRQEIRSFNRQRVPANIILLMDASGSVFRQMRLIREAAKKFAQGLMPEDKVCVMQFADRVELLQDWTSAAEIQRVEKSLDWRYHAGLSTAFYDGLYLAAEEQLRKVEGRKIIILLTDGIDTARPPRASSADGLNAVRRAEASVYVVSLTGSLRALIDKEAGGGFRLLASGYDPRTIRQYLGVIERAEGYLGKLAEETGGRIFLPVKETDLSVAYQAIAEELRTQYVITYKPNPQVKSGEWRRVRVLVLPGGYEVATRVGYNARVN